MLDNERSVSHDSVGASLPYESEPPTCYSDIASERKAHPEPLSTVGSGLPGHSTFDVNSVLATTLQSQTESDPTGGVIPVGLVFPGTDSPRQQEWLSIGNLRGGALHAAAEAIRRAPQAEAERATPFGDCRETLGTDFTAQSCPGTPATFKSVEPPGSPTSQPDGSEFSFQLKHLEPPSGRSPSEALDTADWFTQGSGISELSPEIDSGKNTEGTLPSLSSNDATSAQGDSQTTREKRPFAFEISGIDYRRRHYTAFGWNLKPGEINKVFFISALVSSDTQLRIGVAPATILVLQEELTTDTEAQEISLWKLVEGTEPKVMKFSAKSNDDALLLRQALVKKPPPEMCDAMRDVESFVTWIIHKKGKRKKSFKLFTGDRRMSSEMISDLEKAIKRRTCDPRGVAESQKPGNIFWEAQSKLLQDVEKKKQDKQAAKAAASGSEEETEETEEL